MRLKSLEIKGFKSFGNATTLYFDENVTGVVGPNGSGKSNVVDAFRWVLGEQKSKELRLEQMGDVLFNGADKKQQANLAEVSVTFDNTKNILPTEYNTVKITRALYRSGESEYRINDVACRLKDIHLLLMDTGIGSNSYSIIELGMVDDILQDKENARRRMFEQAAGISKFKKRKKETLQKLKLTNADLERIEDLLFEIENNLKDLEKQARRTKKYFEIKEKYKASSIILYKLKWDRLEEGVISLNQQISTHKDQYSALTAETAEKESVLESEKKRNLEGEKNLSEFQRKLNDLLDEIRRAENEKNLLVQKIRFSETNIEKAKKDIGESEPQLEAIVNKKQELDTVSRDKEQLYMAEKEKLTTLQEELEKSNTNFVSHKKYQQDKYQQLKQLQDQIFSIDKTYAVTQNKIENIISDRKSSLEEIRRIEEGLSNKQEELKTLKKKETLIDSEIRQLREKETNRVRLIDDLNSKLDTKKDLIAKLNRSLDALSNERNLLQSMIENLEGFSESVKFLHGQWDGKKVLLSDVINTEEEYRAAVEQVLQPYLNYFIVETIDEAGQAIHLLKSTQKGKAQFFILSEIKKLEKPLSDDLTSLASVIETDEKYVDLISLLCGNTFLVEEHQILDEELQGFNLVDKKGSILRSPQHIIGGSIGLFEGKKIGRKKRIEHLDKLITKEKAKILKEEVNLAEITGKIQKEKGSKYDVEIRIKERLKNDVEKEIVLTASFLERSDSNISDLTSKIKKLQEAEKEALDSLNEASVNKKKLETEIQDIQKAVSAQDSEIEVLNTQLTTAREKYNQQNILLIQTENHLSNIKKDISFQDQRELEIKRNIAAAKELVKRQTFELESSNGRLIELTDKLQEKYSQKSKEQEDLSLAEQNYFKARAVANEIEDELRKLSKNINEKQYLINQLKDKLNDYKFKKNSINERLQIEFEYRASDLLNVEVDESVKEGEIEMHVEKFKRRLDNYGEINPMALEAYEEMEKRFVHITEQRDDIESAKVSLMNTISEIEETATQLFLDSFNEVRKHFVVVFRSLFTQDDDCDLILEDPEDPLNSKIEIIAKPKGKRPKSLSQLSGGEKTLTATALLFSLYLLKPAPFCIFDEVDAPLDDSNIQKFSNIIRAFADKSQFIIVTHNKATMAEVDVLYGVFMQKKGISSVSAVDFRSYDEKGTVAKKALETYN